MSILILIDKDQKKHLPQGLASLICGKQRTFIIEDEIKSIKPKSDV